MSRARQGVTSGSRGVIHEAVKKPRSQHRDIPFHPPPPPLFFDNHYIFYNTRPLQPLRCHDNLRDTTAAYDNSRNSGHNTTTHDTTQLSTRHNSRHCTTCSRTKTTTHDTSAHNPFHTVSTLTTPQPHEAVWEIHVYCEPFRME